MGGRNGQSLDVSVGLRTPSGQLLMMQTRQPYEVIWLTSRAVWLTLLPSLALALSLLYLAKIGFAYRLTRNLSDIQEEQVEVADTLSEVARNLRQWVRELRSLIVTVTPPALHTEGLQAALTDLVATLETRGINVELDVQVRSTLAETSESLVYRVAQEAVRNVVRHAHASNVELTVMEDRWLTLQVIDDGQGFDPTSVSARRQGSVGLTLLAALVRERGGRLRVESASAKGRP